MRNLELHKDLIDYVNTTEHGLKVLQHPLCYAVPYFGSDNENARINDTYAAKVDMLEKAINERDVVRVCLLYERPWRMTGLMRSWSILQDHEKRKFWEAAKFVWIDSENIWQNIDQWQEVFKMNGSRRFMHKEEELKLETLFRINKEITIWRGGAYDGLSYTLSEEKAHWFSQRFNGGGKIYEKTVCREQVFAYTNDRNEQEIILKEIV